MIRSKNETAQLSLSDATESYLGYAYQGLFALLALMDADDDESVSVETEDDVVLSGTRETLHQLKHSRTSVRPLTVRDQGLWKTIAIWVDHYRATPGHYVYVTTAPVLLGDVLEVLATKSDDRGSLLTALNAEAKRVARERETARRLGARLPHQRRARGVSAFLGLGAAARSDFISRIALHARAGNIEQLPTEVSKRLGAVLPQVRDRVRDRLIEWWDRRVVLGLTKKRNRLIQKSELQNELSALIAQHRDVALPDDYGPIEPPQTELEWDSIMVAQMQLVNAGQSRILRGLEAHWRAARQRERWLDEDISVGNQLKDFDSRLFRAWRDRHGPICDDCQGRDDEYKAQVGRDLLDWSHTDAFTRLAPVRAGAPHDYLTQGTYQMLSQAKKVGWHPDFEQLLRSPSRRTNKR